MIILREIFLKAGHDKGDIIPYRIFSEWFRASRDGQIEQMNEIIGRYVVGRRLRTEIDRGAVQFELFLKTSHDHRITAGHIECIRAILKKDPHFIYGLLSKRHPVVSSGKGQ
jgi:hypothetical protein